MSATGRCLCGTVSFTAQEVDQHMHACHCSMCRSWTGGPAMSVSVGSVEFFGADKIKRFASSDWAERGFCSDCGSSLFYHMKEPSVYMMNLGAFDDPDQFTVTGEIYIDEKPAGYDFAGDHPRQTGAEFLASLGISPDAPA